MVRSEPVSNTTPLQLFLICNLLARITTASALFPASAFTRDRGRCTPQYWSRQKEAWPKMAPPEATVAKVFGFREAHQQFGSDLTLLEAASRNDVVQDAYAELLKQSTAALLNSYSRLGFPFRAWDIKTLIIRAMISPDDAAHQAQMFLQANENCH
ncbi:hypothetical protein V2J09_015648 [Rumex salicifolius]